MKLGIGLGYSPSKLKIPMDDILFAEKMGFDSVWAAESYGSDAVSVASYVLAQTSKIKVGTAIMQMQARTPAMTAMTAISLNALSDNRFLLGLGPSGPQVVEGWYGQAYGRPLTRTKEYISIIRKIIAREEPLQFEGHHYQIPFKGEGSTGLGKPLKIIEKPLRSDIPIYIAAIGPKNIELTAEIADGWLPFMYSPSQGDDIFNKYLEKGFSKSKD